MKIEISVDELNELLNLISPEKVEKIIELIAPAEPQKEPEPKEPTPFWKQAEYVSSTVDSEKVETPKEPNPFWEKTYSGTVHTPTYKVFNEQTK